MGERWRYWRRCRRQDRERREAFRANGDRFYPDGRGGGVMVIGATIDPDAPIPSASLNPPWRLVQLLDDTCPACGMAIPHGERGCPAQECARCTHAHPGRARCPGAHPTGVPLDVEAVREWAVTEPDEDTANATVRRLLEVYDDTAARLRALAEGTALRAEDGPAELTVADYDDLNAAATAAARRMFWLEGAMAKVAAIVDTAEGEPAREIRDVLATHVAPTCGHHYGTVTGCAACVAAAAASARLRERR